MQPDFKSNPRMFAQKGVFVIGYANINDYLTEINIKKEYKLDLRQELKQYFYIEEKTLFQDMYGFALVNNVDHKITNKSAIDYFQEAYEATDNEQKIELYEKVVELAPKYANVHNNLGNAYGEIEEYNKAIESYQLAIELEPEHVVVHNNLGAAYSNIEKYDEAIESYQRAIELAPKYVNAHNNLGNVYSGHL